MSWPKMFRKNPFYLHDSNSIFRAVEINFRRVWRQHNTARLPSSLQTSLRFGKWSCCLRLTPSTPNPSLLPLNRCRRKHAPPTAPTVASLRAMKTMQSFVACQESEDLLCCVTSMLKDILEETLSSTTLQDALSRGRLFSWKKKLPGDCACSEPQPTNLQVDTVLNGLKHEDSSKTC